MSNPTPSAKNFFGLGDASNGVAACQDALNLARPFIPVMQQIPPLTLTGVFDAETHRMAELFQGGAGLEKIDGKIGLKTLNKLFAKAAVEQVLVLQFPTALGGGGGGGGGGGFPLPLPSLTNPMSAVNTADLLVRKLQTLQWLERTKKAADILQFAPSDLLQNGLHPEIFSRIGNAENLTLKSIATQVVRAVDLRPLNYQIAAQGSKSFSFVLKTPARILPAFVRPLTNDFLSQQVGEFQTSYERRIRRAGDIFHNDIFTVSGFVELGFGMVAQYANGAGTLNAKADAQAGARLAASLLKTPLGLPLQLQVNLTGGASASSTLNADLKTGAISGSGNITYGGALQFGLSKDF